MNKKEPTKESKPVRQKMKDPLPAFEAKTPKSSTTEKQKPLTKSPSVPVTKPEAKAAKPPIKSQPTEVPLKQVPLQQSKSEGKQIMF